METNDNLPYDLRRTSWVLSLAMIVVALLLALFLVTRPAKAKTPVTGAGTPVSTAKMLETAMRDSRKSSWGAVSRYEELAQLFVKNATRWGVDPVLVACVTMAESRFHVKAPPLYRDKCTFRLVGCDRPGPCNGRYVKRCKRVQVNRAEAGMMQVLWFDKSTERGYKECTGHRLTGSRTVRQAKLSPPKVAICVGTYELAKWKQWATKGGYGRIPRWRRMKIRGKASTSFFNRYPELRSLVWVRWYNWGSNKWVGNGYARVVLSCVRRFRAKMN